MNLIEGVKDKVVSAVGELGLEDYEHSVKIGFVVVACAILACVLYALCRCFEPCLVYPVQCCCKAFCSLFKRERRQEI